MKYSYNNLDMLVQ